jgi:hypothetical protein
MGFQLETFQLGVVSQSFLSKKSESPKTQVSAITMVSQAFHQLILNHIPNT